MELLLVHELLNIQVTELNFFKKSYRKSIRKDKLLNNSGEELLNKSLVFSYRIKVGLDLFLRLHLVNHLKKKKLC